MCGRYTLSNPDPKRLKLRFGIEGELEFDERPRFNIAPTDAVLAVRRDPGGERQAGLLRWGLLPGRWARRAGQRPLINARAESVATHSAFRESFAERRCLIPADGFYEWRRDENGKVPIWISRPDRQLFAFAGIWARLGGRGEDPLYSCSIITCAPNELLRPIHDRMPVILDPALEGEWLAPATSPEALAELLRPAPADALVTREVGDFVNDVREDGPHLLDPPQRLF